VRVDKRKNQTAKNQRARARVSRSANHKKVVESLLAWFERNARDLPWRRTNDPYAIWVSEVMLQQTQVKTVLPFWEQWMQVLPTIESVAKARPHRVHKLWEGLGYYTRVRNMQKAARLLVRTHQGKFPEQFEQILRLPGIGRYTAGAICSIAFNQPQPVLDGNVRRVLTRLFGISANPRLSEVDAELWNLAQHLVNAASVFRRNGHNRCSYLNQSLMELGALLCTPKEPKCPVCPVATCCVAHQRGLTHRIPNLGARPRAKRRRFVAIVLENDGKFLVRQRPAGVVNAFLWEFPNIEISQNSALKDPVREFCGMTAKGLQRMCTIKHSITRYRITLEVLRSRVTRRPGLLSGQWLNRAQLQRLAFASAHKRIRERLAAE